jgi:hypothetical protein
MEPCSVCGYGHGVDTHNPDAHAEAGVSISGAKGGAVAKKQYHGWILVDHGAPGYKDWFRAEYVEDGVRKQGPASTNPAVVIEWWDARLGRHIKLLETPLGAFRVYTEEEG